MNVIKILRSGQDSSVNFVHPSGQESRFVQRSDDYFIAYLSSHNGCSLACRFCHLTQTGQTEMVPSTLDDMGFQLQTVLDHYSERVHSGSPMASRININWMARGEPIYNPLLRGSSWANTIEYLWGKLPHHLKANFNISTIMPSGFSCLEDLPVPNPKVGKTRLYYSLYSLDKRFRKRWLPRARNPQQALETLATWQHSYPNDTELVLHWAFIKGENDSEDDVANIVRAVKDSGVRARFNVVRYNPFSQDQGEEADLQTIEDRFELLKTVALVPGSKIVGRVGFDVSASCGMFVNLGRS
jgi:23S rRNA (adenine2503-C2)-methyltransferase